MYYYQKNDKSIEHAWAEHCVTFLERRQGEIAYLISKKALESEPFNLTFIEIYAKSLLLLEKLDDAEIFLEKHRGVISKSSGLQGTYFDFLILKKNYPEAIYHVWESIVDHYDSETMKYFSDTLNFLNKTDRSFAASLEILDVEVDTDPLSKILLAFSGVSTTHEDQKLFKNYSPNTISQRLEQAKIVGRPAFSVQPRVLIVSEASIPQCYFYRALQKQEILNLIGVSASLVSWTNLASAFSLINTHTHLILYRVPYRKELEDLVRSAQSLGCEVYYDVDDLVFDIENYTSYLNAQTNIGDEEAAALLDGANDYRQMMCFADYLIGSTRRLCKRMAEIFGKKVFQIDNAAIQIECKETTYEIDLGPADYVKIVYGSGTRTHDEDLKLIETSLVNVMRFYPKSTLILIGPLRISEKLREMDERILSLPLMPRDDYMQVLKRCDIALAPLVSNIFNDCKSSIKLLEAAACGVVTIASSTDSFRDAQERGVPVMLAETEKDWEGALTSLISNRSLRDEMGKSAKSSLAQTFSYEIIAKNQYEIFLSTREYFSCMPGRMKKMIMIVNLFWRPMSFGGATLIAENLAAEIIAIGDFEVTVCTSDYPDNYGEGIRRERVDGIDVFRILSNMHGGAEWSNRSGASYFREVLLYAKPDLVHFHCIQGMGVELLSACCELDIPYIVTVHDAWWLCSRQFLIRGNGTHCGQQSIDSRVCAGCVDNPEFLNDRIVSLTSALSQSKAIIAPSRYWRNFYVQNGFAPEKVFHIENGIKTPMPVAAASSERPRFGFIGGMQVVKGYETIRKAFDLIDSDAWELHFFDASTRLGGSPFSIPCFGKGEIVVHPGYSQDEIDEAYAKFDALLFPSLWPESFGLAVREAIVRGKWVITTNAGGQCEPIVDGVNGRLIPLDDDGTDLAAAVREFIEEWNRGAFSQNFHPVTTVHKNARLTSELYWRFLEDR